MFSIQTNSWSHWRSVTFALVVVLMPYRLQADPLDDARCNFTDCTASPKATKAKPGMPQPGNPFTVDGSSAKEVPNSNGFTVPKLPLCVKSDELACKEDCRSLFDQEFHRCVKECLGKRCVDPVTNAEDQKKQSQIATICLQTESKGCDLSCKSYEDAKKARCRKECLQGKCPNADPLEMAKESAEPGALKCESCRAEYKDTCARDCGLGVFASPLMSTPGLVTLGCEKACIVISCSESCGGKLGW